uniref:Multiprotein-bridging factor 1 n=1 Tax=Endocarpon pusillum TaxID=364733 RepID=F8QWU9_9EURO|nr:multiprotein bridging factor 1 [Endocarpon pusillum]
MSDEWDTFTHIGQSRSGGGGAPRSKTIKSKAELNAAMRSGDVSSQKRFGSANSKSDPEGQRLTKIANTDGIIKPNSSNVHPDAKTVPGKARAAKGWEQKDLARLCNIDVSIVQKFEAGKETPSQKALGAMERHLGISLRGDTFGKEKTPSYMKKGDKTAEKKGKEKK